jgi:hypothetical protein
MCQECGFKMPEKKTFPIITSSYRRTSCTVDRNAGAEATSSACIHFSHGTFELSLMELAALHKAIGAAIRVSADGEKEDD